ncbi:MAG: glycoside hydrolase family 3 N-terminal domain-containing protein [Candidatus Pacearchaeota archaeon]|jgi:beta-glucosidase-like glycosyl hydrolase
MAKIDNTIYLSKLTLREKIGQLIIVKPQRLDKRYIDELHVGGIFLNNLKSSSEYSEVIGFYQDVSKIKLFVATDMEGYLNPFSKFYSSKNFSEITDEQEAYDLGIEQGKILSELGFNLNFSPVVETRNEVWPGRSFTGTKEQIKEKINAYMQGLRKYKIFTTAKHYPGGSLIKNPHLLKFRAPIFEEDLEYFDYAMDKDVDAIMVGHPIVYGAIDSNGKQASRSREILEPLRKKFDGLIITDAVTMLGLRLSYLFDFKSIYPDLIRAGNDIILDTSLGSGYSSLKNRIEELEDQIKKGKLSEEIINSRVKKILEKKGYLVLR